MSIDLSVIVPVKNEEKYIREALDSVCSQSGVEFEVNVIDDHSTDNTRIIIDDMRRQYRNFTVIDNPRHGKVAAVNVGVTIARGRFVCLFAGDDVMPPGSLAARFHAFQSESDDTAFVGLNKLTVMSKNRRVDGQLIPRARGQGAMSGASMMMNRMAVRKIFPIPEELPNEDTWMQLCVRHFGELRVGHSDVVCCHWRLHSGNSINALEPFDIYSGKVAARARAAPLFLARHRESLALQDIRFLEGRIVLEEKRAAGDVLGVIVSAVPLIDRLRALSVTTSFFHRLRGLLFGFFSGW